MPCRSSDDRSLGADDSVHNGRSGVGRSAAGGYDASLEKVPLSPWESKVQQKDRARPLGDRAGPPARQTSGLPA